MLRWNGTVTRHRGRGRDDRTKNGKYRLLPGCNPLCGAGLLLPRSRSDPVHSTRRLQNIIPTRTDERANIIVINTRGWTTRGIHRRRRRSVAASAAAPRSYLPTYATPQCGTGVGRLISLGRRATVNGFFFCLPSFPPRHVTMARFISGGYRVRSLYAHCVCRTKRKILPLSVHDIRAYAIILSGRGGGNVLEKETIVTRVLKKYKF